MVRWCSLDGEDIARSSALMTRVSGHGARRRRLALCVEKNQPLCPRARLLESVMLVARSSVTDCSELVWIELLVNLLSEHLPAEVWRPSLLGFFLKEISAIVSTGLSDRDAIIIIPVCELHRK